MMSKKLIPRSIARSMIASLSSSSSTQSRHSGLPKLMQPRQIRLISILVEPSVVYSMIAPRTAIAKSYAATVSVRYRVPVS